MAYLELKDGMNEGLFLTGIKVNHGTNEKPTKSVSLSLTTKPSNEDFNAPFTNLCKFNLPAKDDSSQAKIIKDNLVKANLFPLAGLEPTAKVKFSALIEKIQTTLLQYDCKINLMNEHKLGSQLTKNGEEMYFDQPLGIEPLEWIEKKAYESDIDYDV